jgi:hypothetical protein
MLQLDFLSLESGLLEVLCLSIKKNRYPPLAIYWKLLTWPRRNVALLNYYLRRVGKPVNIFPPSYLPGTSTPTSYMYSQSVSSCGLQVCLAVDSPLKDFLKNKPCADI